MSDRFRCAVSAQEAHEPRYATASTVRRWLLVEQSGPWGVDAVTQSRLPPDLADELVVLGGRLRARVLLIRRHGAPGSPGCAFYAALTGVDRWWLESFALDSPADILDLDLAGLRRGDGVGGRREDRSLLLVCTNGSHDPCCAEFGRPVAAALTAAFGDRVWEVSHIGGDRFAGNVVTLPDGLYYGGLDPQRAVAVARTHSSGRIDLDAYRGRSALPFAVQAAEYFLRRERGLDAIGVVRWVGRERLADDRWRIGFRTPTGCVDVDVAVGHEPEPRQLTCRATALARPPTYALLAVTTRT